MADVQDFALTSTPMLIASGVGWAHIHTVSGPGTIVLGGSSVTTTSGFQIEAPSSPTKASNLLSFNLGSTDELYAVSSTSLTIRVLRTR